MKPPRSFLWHDYETFGANPRSDRPAQFAAIRTNAELEPVADPISWYCRPANDLVPHPIACLITGITPQKACEAGLREADFAQRIHAEMMVPGTCSVGYNNIHFDDVVTRHLLYRNLRDAYEREYRNGNSRWDLIDLSRMCYALRPDGVHWPLRDDEAAARSPTPVPSFRLEDLTAANGIEHGQAHDALADVTATIEWARRLRQAQPRLFEWALGLRDTATAQGLLDPVDPRPVLHTSSRIPAARGCTTLVWPLAVVPDRPKSVIVFDLMGDPAPLLEEPADRIADRVFTPTADMPEGEERLPLKVVHCNHVPMLAPEATLKGVDQERIALDRDRCLANAEVIRASIDTIRPKVIEVFNRPYEDAHSGTDTDPDVALYSGGFFPPHDRFLMNKVLQTPAEELGSHSWSFEDPRLPALLFRFRARNYPDTLSPQEVALWDQYRAQRLLSPPDSPFMGYEAFQQALTDARALHADAVDKQRILDQVESWLHECGLEHVWRENANAAAAPSRPAP
ncbi:exodeoxyribonuclease I [Elongatibacter sediminis]|uniref:Exodeoxyribonuclease I n=1 Tax=Elongatibacter sediminis TaxID=3119006 RepID=A0AAW9RIU9_9GAMM